MAGATKQPTRILLADNHVGVRQALAMFVDAQTDLETIAQASDGGEMVELALDLRPDVLVVDISKPVLSGLEGIEKIREQWPEVRALVYSMHTGLERVRAAVDVGAMGYVSKDASSEQLVAAIRSVAEGQTFFSTPAQANPEGSSPSPRGASGTAPDGLSPREHEVLILVARGFTSKEIAQQLAITAGSVDTYRVRITRKLGVKSRAELVQYALDVGILR